MLQPTIFPTTETIFQLPTSTGELEVLASPVDDFQTPIAIICHPHPLHGGTMNNKVVSTLARAFKELGLPTVRFNFRGVGKSTGSFAEGIGELDDLMTVIRWVKSIYPNRPLWLAGFSFGAYIATCAATKIEVAQLVTIAPQVSRFIEAQLPPVTCPWILVQGEQDEVVSPQEVFAWIETINPKPIVIRMQAGHFFHGKLLELRQLLEEQLQYF